MVLAPRGTKDLLPGEIERWHALERVAREVSGDFGFQEIRTPIFEHTELFLRGIGDATDIVQKEMYTFSDRGGRSVTLRPEGTAAVVRAYLEHHLNAQPQPVKLYYLGPMFRYDRPQAGRFRQFHQLGVEAVGSDDPALDAEIVCFSWEFFTRLGLTGLQVNLNSVGCPRCRPQYGRALLEYFEPLRDQLCDSCRDRLEKNPLRLLDCKSESCQALMKNAPQLEDYLCDHCRKHFYQVRQLLTAVDIPYTVSQGLVRGLDYYTNTVFEVTVNYLGAQSSICGGGRYNYLVETCGGEPTPGVGVAFGLERILLALEKLGVQLPLEKRQLVYVTTAGDEPQLAAEAFKLVTELRRAGFTAEKDYLGRSLKGQMKAAGKLGARYVVLIGSDELSQGMLTLKDMEQGQQLVIERPQLFALLAETKNREADSWTASAD